MSKTNAGHEFIKEMREKLSSESKKLKWQRLANHKKHNHGGSFGMSKAFIMKRYLEIEE